LHPVKNLIRLFSAEPEFKEKSVCNSFSGKAEKQKTEAVTVSVFCFMRVYANQA